MSALARIHELRLWWQRMWQRLTNLDGQSNSGDGRSLIFAFVTDERTLHVFGCEALAFRYAEGIDVEDGVWLFFAEDGSPLVPVFARPNQRGRFSVVSGAYSLYPSTSQEKCGLLELLPSVSAVEGEFDSVDAVRQFLTKR